MIGEKKSECDADAALVARFDDLEKKIEKLKTKKNPVDTFAKISNALAVVLVAPAIALAGHWIQNGIQLQEQAARQRELDLKAVEISIGILQSDPVAEDYDLRKWAARNISLLNPENPLDEKAQEQIVERPLILGPSATDVVTPLQYLKDLQPLGRPGSIDILSWNLETLSAEDPQDILNTANILSKLNIDVIILQEVGRGVAEKLVTTLGNDGQAYSSVVGVTSIRKLGLAVLFKTSQFNFETWTDEGSPLYKRFRSTTAGGKRAFTYDPIALTLTPKSGDRETLTIIGVHLKSQYGGNSQTAPLRIASAKSLAKEARKLLREEKGSLMIAGSFNNTIASREFATLTSAGGAIALSNKIEIDGKSTWIEGKRFSSTMLDHVFVFPGERRASDFSIELIELDKYIAQYTETVSDHRPLLTRIK